MESDRIDPKKPKPSNAYLKYSSLGFQLLGSIGLCAWLGYRIDLYFHFSFPVFLLSLVMLAFVGNMVLLYRSVNKD
jgi:F0F1-type ATP synthase assembly protein I